MRNAPWVVRASIVARGRVRSADEKQLSHRLPSAFVASILADFNVGRCDAASASSRLEISRSQLYALRHRWLKSPDSFLPLLSGGDHAAPWPPRAAAFAREFLPHCRPLDFALFADELARRLGFHRSRATVAAWCRGHLPELVALKRFNNSYSRTRQTSRGRPLG